MTVGMCNAFNFGPLVLQTGEATTRSLADGLIPAVPVQQHFIHQKMDAIIDHLYDDAANLPVYHGKVIRLGAKTIVDSHICDEPVSATRKFR